MIIKYKHTFDNLATRIIVILFGIAMLVNIILNIIDKDVYSVIIPAVNIILLIILYRNATYSVVLNTDKNLIYLSPNRYTVDINEIKFLEPERRHNGSIKSVLIRTSEYNFIELKLKNGEKFIADMQQHYPHIRLKS